MQDPHASIIAIPADPQRAPLPSDIERCAQNLWLKHGQPADHDLAIWLEAERTLYSVSQPPSEPKSHSTQSFNQGQPKPLHQ